LAARQRLALAAALSIQCLFAQAPVEKLDPSDLWQHVGSRPTPKFASVTLLESQRQAIIKLLKARVSLDSWCESAGDPEWLNTLSYETIPLSARVKVLLIEAGRGCARSGQGSNGAMWLIRFDDPRPTLLASPQQAFNGWIYSVEPKTSYGYRDIVLGWHMSAFEAGLTYFRFDGELYQSVSSATFREDEDGTRRIIPKLGTGHP
jgi:hypothetical protein